MEWLVREKNFHFHFSVTYTTQFVIDLSPPMYLLDVMYDLLDNYIYNIQLHIFI